MKHWQKILIPTLITLLIGGGYLYSVWRHRQNPGVIPNADAGQTLSKDDLAVVRAFFPAHFEDTLRLEGTSVWMKNGYTMSYFPYAGGHIEFAKRVGVIPSAERLDVKKIVKAAVPAGVDDGIEHGSRQAFAVFSLKSGTGLFATPIGTKQGMSELETRMAIGQKTHPDGQTEGDRTVTYDQDGKHWTITYVKNRATTIQSTAGNK